MTIRQFEEWKDYEDLEPFGEIREDIRNANIVQALYNIHRKKGAPRIKLSDCVVNFGKKGAPEQPKTVEDRRKEVRKTMEMLMMIYNKKPRRKR